VDVGTERYVIHVEEQTRYINPYQRAAPAADRAAHARAPLPGRIVKVAVKPGIASRMGATLLVIEAMKMENEFRRAPRARSPRCASSPVRR